MDRGLRLHLRRVAMPPEMLRKDVVRCYVLEAVPSAEISHRRRQARYRPHVRAVVAA